MTRTHNQRLASVFAASLTLLVSALAHAEPPRAEVLDGSEFRPDEVDSGPSGLMVGGLSTLATFYAAGGIVGLVGLGEYDHTAWALVPIGGPFVAATLVEPKSEQEISHPEIFRAGLVVAGVGQIIGATFTLIGLMEPEEQRSADVAFRVTPSAPGADVGLGIRGSF